MDHKFSVTEYYYLLRPQTLCVLAEIARKGKAVRPQAATPRQRSRNVAP